MPRVSTPPASNLIEEVKKGLTTSEQREWNVLDRKVSRMWRNFWIKAAKRQGHSNVEIAKAFEMSESSIRSVLSK